MGIAFALGGRRPGYGIHEYYDAMTKTDEPWKYASLGLGIGGPIVGLLLCAVNPIIGIAVFGGGILGGMVCGIVAQVKHNSELRHYIMEDRKRLAEHCDVKDKTLESNVELNQATTKKINAETQVIENSTKNVNNSDASLSKDTINSSKSTDISK